MYQNVGGKSIVDFTDDLTRFFAVTQAIVGSGWCYRKLNVMAQSELLHLRAINALSRQEQRYCITQRELLAVIDFVQPCFRHYLLGWQFTLRTDHATDHWYG